MEAGDQRMTPQFKTKGEATGYQMKTKGIIGFWRSITIISFVRK